MRAHLQRVADAFDGKRSGVGFEAHCPLGGNHAHNDRDRSLTITLGTDKPDLVVVTCGRGCDWREVLAAKGLAPADCWPDNTGKAPSKKLREFKYYDEHGTAVFRVVRGENAKGGRTWSFQHPTDTGWKSGRGGPPGLYNLPRIVAEPDLPVFICEGERDAETIAACGSFVTTTVPSGSFKDVDLSVLRGRDVWVVVDNDDRGWKRGKESLEAAQKAGALVQGGQGDTITWNVLRPPDAYKDATDYLSRPGNTFDGFVWDVDLFASEPPVWSWEATPDPKRPLLDEFTPDGRATFSMMPVSLLLAGLDLASIAVFLVLDAKAGTSGLAKVTHAEISELLGTRRQTISAHIKKLEGVGFIAKEKRGWYRIHNPARRNTPKTSSSHKTPHTPENGPQTEPSTSGTEHSKSDERASDRTLNIEPEVAKVAS